MNKIKLPIFFLIALVACNSDDTPIGPITDATILIESDILEETLLEDIIEDPSVADYIVQGYLDVRALLTIEPGVVIAFEANSGFYIEGVGASGAIRAVGTSQKPILFTGIEKVPGFWRGITVLANDVRNELNYCVLEYAGSDDLVAFGSVKLKGGLAVEDASGFNGSLKLKNTTIQSCLGYGFIVEQGAVLREFSSNSFFNNKEAAVRIDAENTDLIDANSTFSGNNGIDGVEINASGSATHRLTADATWVSLKEGANYVISQTFSAEARLTIAAGATLAFEANQTITFREDFSGNNDGILIANGTASKNITFTAVEKQPGYWQGLVIRSSSNLNSMEYCVVEFGGSDLVSGLRGNIILDKDGAFDAPQLTITNSVIRNGLGCGIAVDSFGGMLTESDNSFAGNNDNSICM
ncbi:hypothetical protein GCM10011506_24410 [Marivirga lumbricoides]|uniref:Right handed beta helix domain-containing protein n=1 Tax=Marivirga lumbricoides TaxID=1046115 RepID=A0ABQ1MC42_9BACT|nr:hypothetical protein GCM10011506_24410 [Marivirga lumbricoides]